MQARRLGSLTLDTVNEDVLGLIVNHLHPAALQHLASSSHKLRVSCLPVLFSRCTVDIRRHGRGFLGLPEEVRVHVRHLTHLGPLGEEQDVEHFEALLDSLPVLQSVTIKDAAGQIPWGIWKACISRSRIESLSYDARHYDVPPFPSDEVEATCVSLRRFSHTTTLWRELRRTINMWHVFEFERQCLSPIVLRMNKTAISLTLPLESTPVHAMGKLPWPNLKELHLHGRFLEVAQVKHTQHLLQSLPSLVRLSILAARTAEVGRPALLPHPASNTSGSSSDSFFSQLRALEIAHPDPMDGMFSMAVPLLSHLALRDYPRIYHNYANARPRGESPMTSYWYTPLLLDSEILYILRHMQLPPLTSLEIVYEVTDEASDNELLSYIVDAFPHLEQLEIHRYRRRRTILTRHKPIIEILSRAQSLRVVRLNLEFHDDTQVYYGYSHLREKWLRTFRYERGPEIVQVMQACPVLEHVAILLHGAPSSIWVEVHPSRCPERPEPRCVEIYDQESVDAEMMLRPPILRL